MLPSTRSAGTPWPPTGTSARWTSCSTWTGCSRSGELTGGDLVLVLNTSPVAAWAATLWEV